MSSCEHTLEALLSRTIFAQDGQRMGTSKAYLEQRKLDAQTQLTQSQINSVMRMQNQMVGDVSLVGETPIVTSIDTQKFHKVTDRGPRLHSFNYLREYATYQHDHADVYDAIVSLFGQRTFASDSPPSDALAFAVAAATIFKFGDAIGLNAHIPQDLAEKAAIVQTLIAIDDDYVKRTATKAAQEKGDDWKQFYVAYMALLKTRDKSSTFMTDILWSAMCSTLGLIGDITVTASDKFMHFVANVRSVSIDSAHSTSLTAQGDILYDANIHKVVGYCRNGAMLRRLEETLDQPDMVITFQGLFCQTFHHYNAKNNKSVCAGCNLQMTTDDGRIYRYKNDLLGADIRTATDVKVLENGTAKIEAETVALDKKTGNVVRTGLRKLTCDLYDVHMLAGIDVEGCKNLSCLFPVDHPWLKANVVSTGVRAWATVERMDDYKVDKAGRILSITHGGQTKFAERDGKVLRWGDKGGAAFTIDDIIM